MTRAKISEYDASAANNTDVNGVNIAEGCPPSSMNNMGREIMAALKRFETGADGDSLTVGGSLYVTSTSSFTGTATFLGATSFASAPVISALTASQPVFTNGSKALSNTPVAFTWTASQRGTVTTDNDGSFDMNVTNNFKATPTGNFTLTFTNITAGQSGFILLVNSGGYTVSAHANTKVSATGLATITAAGTYLLSYFSDGTNVYVVNSSALS
jgi:hypothetical protein